MQRARGLTPGRQAQVAAILAGCGGILCRSRRSSLQPILYQCDDFHRSHPVKVGIAGVRMEVCGGVR